MAIKQEHPANEVPGPAPKERRLARTVVTATIMGVLTVVLVHVPFFIVMLATGADLDETLHDLAILATFGAIVAVGIISGVGAAMIAGSHHPRRRVVAVVLFLLMTGAVGSTLVMADVAAGADIDENEMLVLATFIVTGISVLLGTLLGYVTGRERRLARERAAA